MKNRDWLAATTYPGRGIVVGLSADGTTAIQVFWTMGRSSKSRNRLLVADADHVVRTQLAAPDPAVGDTSLIVYRALARAGEYEIVSNGTHTDLLVTGLIAGVPFSELCLGLEVEPDPPNFTSRIAGVFDRRARHYALAAARAPSNDTSQQQVQATTYLQLKAGRGHCITTYDGDGDPLPPFTGEPFAVAIGNRPDAVATDYWSLLDPDNRVSLVVKAVSLATAATSLHIINRHAAVPSHAELSSNR